TRVVPAVGRLPPADRSRPRHAAGCRGRRWAERFRSPTSRRGAAPSGRRRGSSVASARLPRVRTHWATAAPSRTVAWVRRRRGAQSQALQHSVEDAPPGGALARIERLCKVEGHGCQPCVADLGAPDLLVHGSQYGIAARVFDHSIAISKLAYASLLDVPINSRRSRGREPELSSQAFVDR